jgi:DNA (cytosine-5)-methyltransferase 1
MNPSVIIFENTPRFGVSETLGIIKRSFPDYNFTQQVFNGHDYGELEARKRVCIIAVSKGLPPFDLSVVKPVMKVDNVHVRDFLTPVAEDSTVWREMAHVKARDSMTHVGYKNCLYHGNETKMVTIPASYAPKAGTPMIAHPTDSNLQRQIQVDEHIRLREMPDRLTDTLLKVWKGDHPMISKRGSAAACHRMLGNGVSRKIWTAIGFYLGLNFVNT